MLEFGNKEWRNLQEQVGKNKEDIAGLQQMNGGLHLDLSVQYESALESLVVAENVGKIIYCKETKKLYSVERYRRPPQLVDRYRLIEIGPFPAEGPEGPQGEQGPQGPQGERAPGIYGTSASLPQVSTYQLGDLYVLTNGEIYKAVKSGGNKVWILQANFRGPQGLDGASGDEVQANPSQTTDILHSIGIDGINYALESELTEDDRAMLNNLEEYAEWDEDGNLTLGAGLYVDGDIMAGGSLILSSADVITDEDGNKLVQRKLTAGTGITIVNDVISATGVTQVSWGGIEGTLSNQSDLQNALSSKATNSALNNEIYARTQADATLSSELSAEASARLASDTNLNTLITTETSVRAQADNVLSSRIDSVVSNKQDKLTAGSNINISGNTISATDTTYTAGSNINISGNTISATDTTYTAGTGINITGTVISATGGSSSKLYRHTLNIQQYSANEKHIYITIITNRATAYTSVSEITISNNAALLYDRDSDETYPCVVDIVDEVIQGYQPDGTYFEMDDNLSIEGETVEEL